LKNASLLQLAKPKLLKFVRNSFLHSKNEIGLQVVMLKTDNLQFGYPFTEPDTK